MMHTVGNNVGLSVFFVILVVTVQVQSSCIDDIRKNLGKQLVGGYSSVENPQKDGVVKGIVESGLKKFNHQSDDLKYALFEDGKIEAYKQMVNGLNYCVQFTLESGGCVGDACKNKEKKVNCVLTAYKSFPDKEAKINAESLKCTAVA